MTGMTFIVLISGNGSNLQSIIDSIDAGQIKARLSAVISNNADAYGLTRAKNHAIETRVIDHRLYDSRDSFDQALLQCIKEFEPDYIVLAGFMRILGSALIHAYKNKILNIHPSLLPNYKGLNTHQRAIDNRENEHGVSIHVVTAELDDGPVLMRGRYAIETDDTATDLQYKGHQLEHRMYPKIIQWLSERKLKIGDHSIEFEEQVIHEPIEFDQI
jgi:phosphoribosylglycinamide formyltransferase-1